MTFSPQIPSFTVPKESSKPPALRKVKELPASPVKKESPPLSGTFTCKDPGEAPLFTPSLLTLATDYQFEDADYTIWSSDVISFKVHSYRLKAASPYFREIMKEDKTSTSVSLAENGYSGALVVKNLLDIIYTSEPVGCHNIDLAFQVITMATKWECEAVLKILKKDLAIQALINSTNGPSTAHLRLALKLGDHHLMALIAQRDRDPGPRFVLTKDSKTDPTGVHKLHDKPAAGILEASAGLESPFYELGGLSYADFLKLPPTVLWALARATYLARVDHGEVDEKVMAGHFETLLKQAYPAPVILSAAVISEPVAPQAAEPSDPTPSSSQSVVSAEIPSTSSQIASVGQGSSFSFSGATPL